MKITRKKGKKAPKDFIYFLNTDGEEAWSIYRLGVMLNLLSINEQEIRKANNYTKNYYREALQECLDMSEEGVDWTLEENKDKVLSWAIKHHLRPEIIEEELARIRQMKLTDFSISEVKNG